MKMLAAQNGQWKGDKVKYIALHVWVKRRLKMPKCCPHCGKVGKLDLANKGIYNRNLKNWEYLCRRCHMLADGRLLNNKKCRPIIRLKFEEHGIAYKKYPSLTEASKDTGIRISAIANNLKGLSKFAGGFSWHYIPKDIPSRLNLPLDIH